MSDYTSKDISVVIPTYNASDTISELIESVLKQDPPPGEILIIDDVSRDDTVETAGKYPVKVIVQDKNSGPARARNTGVKEATGSLIMYLDSDTALEAGSIDSAVKGFNGILKVQAQNGVCSPVPLNKGIFAQYKALVEASWADDIDNWDSSSACINARVGVFTKASLNEAGGFNENYPDASVEDHEFGIRYSKKYRIYTNKDIIARHKFPGFKKTVINYWDRTYKMMQLANKHKDALKTGGVSVRSALQYLMCPLFLLLLPFALLFPIVWFLWLAATVVFMVTSINVIKRLFSKGPFFGIFGIVIHAVYGVVITLSALKFYLKLLLKR